MKRIGIIAKEGNTGALRAAQKLAAWFTKRHIEPIMGASLARRLGRRKGRPPEKIPDLVDLLVVLGGDGTLLSAARLMKGRNVPILGVNLGGLGFLTAVGMKELTPLMPAILSGDFSVEKRMMLSTSILRGGSVVGEYTVLNDAVINKGAMARIIQIKAEVNGEFLTTFRADGLVLSTPTGSTAYSMSAGGPIITPSLDCIIVTPICPHTLTNRPLVVTEDAVIRVTVSMSDGDVYLTLDGQIGRPLRKGDIIEVKHAGEHVHLVRPSSRSYYRLLREKLTWGQP